jgi:hypothetical protein
MYDDDEREPMPAEPLVAALAALLPGWSVEWEMTGGNCGTIVGRPSAALGLPSDLEIMVGPGCYSAGTLDDFDLSAGLHLIVDGDLEEVLDDWMWSGDESMTAQDIAADIVHAFRHQIGGAR